MAKEKCSHYVEMNNILKVFYYFFTIFYYFTI